MGHALNYAASGIHRVNLVLHLGFTWTILVQAHLPRLSRHSALLATLIFQLHPLATEPISFVTPRSQLLASLFYVLALAGFARCGQRLVPGIAGGLGGGSAEQGDGPFPTPRSISARRLEDTGRPFPSETQGSHPGTRHLLAAGAVVCIAYALLVPAGL